MSRFLSGQPVPVGRRAGRRTYRFHQGAQYEVGAIGSGWIETVPASFVFDNSAPWWIAWALPRRRMLRACGLHDWLRAQPDWSLAACDAFFLEAMSADAVREPFLTLCWWAVRGNKNRGFAPPA